MGAYDIEFILEGSKTFSDVKIAFERRCMDDASENGHANGYSGDFQTVHRVEDHGGKVFDSYSAAKEYCLGKATKWESVVAVKYKSLGKVIDAKLNKLEKRLSDAQKARTDAGSKVADAIYKAKSLLIGCKGCGSKITRARLHSVNCPVCQGRLVAPSAEKRLAKLDAKIDACSVAIVKRHNELTAKVGKANWLIAGWGAC